MEYHEDYLEIYNELKESYDNVTLHSYYNGSKYIYVIFSNNDVLFIGDSDKNIIFKA